jgi:hypothetical protein
MRREPIEVHFWSNYVSDVYVRGDPDASPVWHYCDPHHFAYAIHMAVHAHPGMRDMLESRSTSTIIVGENFMGGGDPWVVGPRRWAGVDFMHAFMRQSIMA